MQALQKLRDKIAELTTRLENWKGYSDEPGSWFQGTLRLLEEVEQLQRPRSQGAAAEAPASDADWAAFERWLAAPPHNVTLPAGVQIRHSAAHGHGLWATQALPADTLIMSLPRSVMLRASAVSSALVEFAAQQPPLRNSPPHVVLALALLLEKGRGAASPFAPYVAVLPRAFGTPTWFGAAEWAALRGSPLLPECARTVFITARMYVVLHRLLHESAPAALRPLVSAFTWRGFAWAMAAVQSRQHTESAEACLVPLWDLLNAATDGPLTSSFDPATERVEFRTAAAVAAGSEVLMVYGARSNHELLLNYGFVPDAPNPHDRLPLPFGLSDADPLLPAKRAACIKLQLTEKPLYLRAGAPADLLSPELLALLRIAQCNDASQLSQVVAHSRDPLQAAADAPALSVLAALCRTLLSRYPPPPAAPAAPGTTLRSVQLLVAGERRLLEAAAALAPAVSKNHKKKNKNKANKPPPPPAGAAQVKQLLAPPAPVGKAI